jgi:hypothetical protein
MIPDGGEFSALIRLKNDTLYSLGINIKTTPPFGCQSIDELTEVKRRVWFLGMRKLLHAVPIS